MEYDIVQDLNVSEFIKEVNKKIKEGWEPIGGVCLDDGVFNQVIIKK